MVPRSFSRTTARAVAMTEVTMRMNATSPGTRKRAEARSGLYQISGAPTAGPLPGRGAHDRRRPR